jgi:hypothetical protein
MFHKWPSKMVALREFVLPKEASGSGNTHIRITDGWRDGNLNQKGLEIQWSTTNGAQIQEISYMLIGFAEENAS